MLVKGFEEQVKKYPTRTAVKAEGCELTYEALNTNANKVAYEIIKKCGEAGAQSSGSSLQSEEKAQRVALLFEHGTDMIVGTVGALKACKTYIPFDPAYPEQRLLYMLENSEAHLIVTNSRNMELARKLLEGTDSAITILNIDTIETDTPSHNIEREAKEDRIAYILYTSGSTGNPKGVVQSHKNVRHFIKCYTESFQITQEDKLTLFSAFSHDAAIMDIYSALLSGATLYPMNIKDGTNIKDLAKWMVKEGITIYHSVPTVFRFFANTLTGEESFPALRYIVLGGENVLAHDISLFQNHFKNTTLVNLYGQSESSYNAAFFISPDTEIKKVTLGKTVSETEILLIDEEGDEVDTLQVGEIVIASPYVALGYWQDSERTEKVFTHDEELGSLYWTGDLGRLLRDGTIEFIGRKDHQIKIRGYRVELGEIESRLQGFPGIKDAVVLGKTEDVGTTYLCAYIVAEGQPDKTEVKKYLAEALPEYMIPAYLIQLDAMPLTPNKKIDRKALPEPIQETFSSAEYEAPQDETEKQLAEIWQEVLGVPKVGINDSFFELGGHSLKAAAMTARVYKVLNRDIPLSLVFTQPTIKQLAEYIRQSEQSRYQAIEPIPKRDYYAASASQKRIFVQNSFSGANTAYNISLAIQIKGTIDKKRFEKALSKLVERHEALRTSFAMTNGEIVQKIHEDTVFKLEHIKAAEEAVEETISNLIKPFELSESSLFRAALAEIAEDKHILLLDMHHIISDGTSGGILVQEFLRLYHGEELAPLKIQYKDYAAWHNGWMESEAMKKQETYWVSQYEKDVPLLDMPLDFKRPEKQSFEGKTLKFTLSKEILEKAEALCKAKNITLNTFLFGIYNILLSRYTKQQDIIVGTIVAGRRHPDVEKVIGMFVNYLPIRSRIEESEAFEAFLEAQQNRLTAAYDHQDYPFEEIVQKVIKKADLSRNPLFDTMLIFHNENDSGAAVDLEGLKISEYSRQRNTAKLDFKIDAWVSENHELIYQLEYNTSLFQEETMQNFAKHFALLAERVLQDPKQTIQSIPLFTEEEKVRLSQKKKANQPPAQKAIKLAVTATFTPDPLKEYIEWWCGQFGELVEAEIAPYNQVFQQLLDPASLISTNTGANLLLLRFEDWLRDSEAGEAEQCRILEGNFTKLTAIMKTKQKPIPYFVPLFPLSTHLPLGDKVINTLKDINSRWKDTLGGLDNVYILDFTEFYNLYHIERVFDPIKDKAGHIPFTEEFYAAAGTAIARTLCAWKKQHFKVIALDCDNTLWRGVCGEEGALGVQVDAPYQALQQFLIQKSREGMLLVLCSKNNEADVWEVFDKNPHMLLKKEHIAGWKINWQRKSDNLKALAKELNLGIDSFIFIDDSPMECSDVMTNCPTVLTLRLPENPAHIPAFTNHVWAFDRLKVTEEDQKRTQMYIAEKKRQDMQSDDLSLDDFLRGLQLKMSMNPVTKEQIPRVSQLTQRTNQFNLSTIRRSEEEIENLLKTSGMTCRVIEACDTFGDYGLVGVVITEERQSTLVIDTFLLSCRALGRNIEGAILAGLRKHSEEKGIQKLEATYRPTVKNTPFLEFIQKTGWKAVEEAESGTTYQMELEQIPQNIPFIECFYNATYKTKGTDILEPKDTEVGPHTYSITYNEAEAEAAAACENSEWEVYAVNEENLLHRSHLLPLQHHRAEKLLNLPIHKASECNIMRQEYIAPSDETEEKLAKIWSEVLKIERVGVMDNFFHLGGHSLNAVNVIGKIFKVFQVEIPLTEMFKTPTVKGLSEYIRKAGKRVYASIEPVGDMEYYPLTSAQKRIHILQQLNQNSTAYNITGAVTIKGVLVKEKLEDTFRKLIDRHESLRTYFEMIEEEPVQKIAKSAELHIDWNEMDGEDQEALKEAARRFARPFDLSKAPLFRIGIIKLAEDTHILMYDMHHIISDGTSVFILIREFAALYQSQELPALRIHYKDFAKWQQQDVYKLAVEKQKQYWMDVFTQQGEDDDGRLPILNLPLDYPRPSVQSFEGDKIRFRLDEALTAQIKTLTKQSGATLYMVLLAAYNILLSKYSGQEDIVIGSPVAGRPHADLENIMGMFVNTLAMRNKPKGDKTFKAFLQEVKVSVLAAFEAQDYPFEELVENLNIPRDLSRNPLFDTMLIVQNMDMSAIETEGLSVKPYEIKSDIAKFDMTLSAAEEGHVIGFTIEYGTKLFKKETVERFKNHFIRVLEAVTKQAEVKLRDIYILSKDEEEQILKDFNRTTAQYPNNKTIHQLFEEQSEKSPDKTALVYGDGQILTYAELNQKANQLARILRGKGIKRDSIVGMLTERSPEMIIGILAVLKAGGAYLPIDPAYPVERIRYTLEDSKTSILLTQSHLKDKTDFKADILYVDLDTLYQGEGNNLEPINDAQSLAYIIYTSGSTGKPKGVMIEHRSVINILTEMQRKYPLTESDTYLLKTAYTFDVSVSEIFGWFMGEGRLAILEKYEEKDPKAILEAVERYDVTHINFVPSMLNILLSTQDSDIAKMKGLKYVFAAGEAITKDLVKRFYTLTEGVKLENIYGPTEVTIYATGFSLPPYKGGAYMEDSVHVPIGKPLANLKAYVLDKNRSLMPIGVPGELCLSGVGLARGYHGNEELTAEKFADNPFEAPGEKLYKTGDLVRWLPDGNIEYIGRIDHQVKIRGFRIELGEIENQLLTHEKVRQAVVIDRADEQGNKYLCAYIIKENTKEEEMTDSTELRAHLLKVLPEYMIPAYFIFMENIPVTSNGKVDRKALPEPSKKQTAGEYTAPVNETEEKLAAIWQEILGLEKVSTTDSFFQLGGHSLKAASMTAKIHKVLNAAIPLQQIFKTPTIKGLAEYIKAQDANMYVAIQPAQKQSWYKLSSAQKRTYTLHQMNKDGISYNMPTALEIRGRLDKNKLENIFKQLIKRHEALRTSFDFIEVEPVQIIHNSVDFAINHIKAEAQAADLIMRTFVKPFDLSKAPLLRAALVEFSEDRHILLFDMHHIISDGTSMGILTGEFAELYKGASLPDLKIQYKDYAEWQQGAEYQRGIEKQKQHWLNVFSDEIPVLNMSTDYPRPSVQRFEGDRIRFELDAVLTKKVKELTAKNGTTLYMTLLAAFNVLLSKYSGQEDIIIGSPVAGRPHADLEKVMGIFINTLAMRNKPEGDKTFRAFLQEIKVSVLASFESQDYPFEELVENLNIPRDLSRNPLFDIMFILQNMDMTAAEAEGLSFKPYEIKSHIAKLDMTLTAVEARETIRFNLQYSTKLFKKETMMRLANHFIHIIDAVVQDTDIKISDINILEEEEEKQLLKQFNSTHTAPPVYQILHKIFEEVAEKWPTHVALIHEDIKWTYKTLNAKANQLARAIEEKTAIEKDTIIAIMTEPSAEMIAAILAVLKCGAAYMPIDAEFPQDRVRYMLQDSGAKLLLTQKTLAGKAAFSGTIIDLEDKKIYQGDTDNLDKEADPSDLAYVIYTSGTTGMSKGVLIEHHSLVNYVNWFGQKAALKETDKTALLSSFAFDLGYTALYSALLRGAALHIVSKGLYADPQALLGYIRQNEITYIKLTPSLFNTMVSTEKFQEDRVLSSLRLIVLGGEQISTEDIRLFNEKYPKTQIMNHYGPTETTVGTIAQFIDFGKFEDYKLHPTIGKPIDNAQVYILDKNLKPVPIGVQGEMHITGEGLARGYLNRPELTAAKFIPNPFAKEPGQKLYKTGDIGKYMPDGRIEFMGRMDDQIKIRGYRVEPGEIENKLLKHPDILEALVMAREDAHKNKYLCAYIVPDPQNTDDKGLSPAELRKHLSKELPEYMIPSHFVALDKMPLTQNGKVDRKSLPKPEGNILTDAEYAPPVTETEKLLADIWREVLAVDNIGIGDNYFTLGGNSINILRTLNLINKKFDTAFSIGEVFLSPTIAELAEVIDRQKTLGRLESVVKLNKGDSDKNLFILHGLNGDVYLYKELAGLLEGHCNVYGIQAKGFVKESRLPRSSEEAVAYYLEEIKKVQPQGPYRIAGYCIGVMFVYDLARMLQDQGDTVEKMIIIDGPAFISRTEAVYLEIKEAVKRRLSHTGLYQAYKTRLSNKQRKNSLRYQVSGIQGEQGEYVPDKEKIRANNDMLGNVLFKPQRIIRIPTYIIKAEDNNSFNLREKNWKRMVGDEVSLVEMPGDHNTIVMQPNVIILADIVKDILKK